MAADCFAHVAYGVLVTDDTQYALCESWRSEYEDFVAEDESGNDPPSFWEWIQKSKSKEFAYLVHEIGAPGDASLIHTGSEDDRPGRCHTEPDQFVVGYGLLSFPRDFPPFKSTTPPDWHTWVEMG